MRFFSLALLLFCAAFQINAQTKYENNFEKEKVGSVPDDFLVLDGSFSVKEENGNKFLELAGTPLDSFGILFGPNEKENVAVSARIFGTTKGRRYPVFEVGLNGAGGYKLRVSPAKKQLELYRGDALKAGVPFEWQSAKWTFLRLRLVNNGDKDWKIEGEAWQDGGKEPEKPNIVFRDSEAPPTGRSSVGGMPYSGTPIRFDDLQVSATSIR